MDLEYSDAETAFRDDIRAFLRSHLPPELAAKVLGHKRLTREDFLGWHRILHARGWSAPTWPQKFGGPGWTAVEQHIFDEECSAAGAPPLIAFSVRMVAPVLMAYGNAAQQGFFLPRILSGEDWWCQGYSEPGSGSDLASLKTQAVRKGDVYVVNGQKTWNTLGHLADWMFCLVRTSTLSSHTSFTSCSPSMRAIGRTVMPGVFMSMSRNEIPSCERPSVEVRTRQNIQSARCPRVFQVFWPLTTYTSPLRTAWVFSEARSEPEPGSE